MTSRPRMRNLKTYQFHIFRKVVVLTVPSFSQEHEDPAPCAPPPPAPRALWLPQFLVNLWHQSIYARLEQMLSKQSGSSRRRLVLESPCGSVPYRSAPCGPASCDSAPSRGPAPSVQLATEDIADLAEGTKPQRSLRPQDENPIGSKKDVSPVFKNYVD